jgi:transposase
MTMSCDDAGISGVRRFEVFTGVGKRRDWPPEVKALIVAESYSGTESVSAVARRHGMSVSQLFTWRRLLRREMEERGIALPVRPREAPMFVPAVLEEQEPSPPTVASKPASRRRSSRASAIELEIGGALVRIGSSADPDTISAVITALRASR